MREPAACKPGYSLEPWLLTQVQCLRIETRRKCNETCASASFQMRCILNILRTGKYTGVSQEELWHPKTDVGADKRLRWNRVVSIDYNLTRLNRAEIVILKKQTTINIVSLKSWGGSNIKSENEWLFVCIEVVLFLIFRPTSFDNSAEQRLICPTMQCDDQFSFKLIKILYWICYKI